jgi:hypothetical protein
MLLILPDFRLEDSSVGARPSAPSKPMEDIEMAKTKAKTEQKPPADGNRYTRAARVLAKNDKLSVKELADRAFMSETTAARCLEAWHACVGALREAGKLPTPPKAVTAKKKAPPKAKPAALAATETPVETVETTAAT